jgi:diguanylate cyclase (GGDEF)-like protein/PAS domain S-box-containing protein
MSKQKLIQAFFSPAVALMSRLDITRKFLLLGLISLVAITVVTYSLFVSLEQTINTLQRELKGIEIIKPFAPALQVIQQHRGLSAGLLGGGEAMRDRRANKEKEVSEAFAAMEGKLTPGLVSSESFQRIRADWDHLCKEGFKGGGGENFAAHNRLVNRVRAFEGEIADDYGLTLGDELGKFYLIDTIVNKLPHAIEHLGRLRAYGTAILTRKQATAQQMAEMNNLVAELGEVIELLNTSFDKTARYNPALQGLISTAAGEIAHAAQQMTSLVAADILTGHFAARPDDFFGMATGAIDGNYIGLQEALLPAAEALIKARIARAENILRASIGSALLLLLVLAYLAIGISRAIIGNIRSLAHSAHIFAGGDLRERIDLGTHDELGRVGDSFNEMADGFNALLKVSRENEARLLDLSAHLEERVKERTFELGVANEQLRVAATTFETHEAILITDADANIIRVNRAFTDITGYAPEEVLGKNPSMLSSGRHDKAFYAAMWQQLLDAGSWTGEVWDRRKNGQVYPKWLTITAVKNEEQKTAQYVSIFSDITERKQAENEIHNLAFYDALTNLPNRRLMLDRFQLALSGSARHNQYGAVLFLDMDRFKVLNDTLGHDCGDLMLIEVATRIQSCVREVDTVARLGGDEFVVLLEELDAGAIQASQKAALIAEKIRVSLSAPYRLKDNEHFSSPSIGVCLYHGNAESVDTLLKQADLAMYQAKNSGRNAVRFFDPEMQQAVEPKNPS